ncbi:MAG: hypothetical protein COA78_28090 [Blastopirellula sp.]|nr:MAG: hypothetical protein COA78_28090 [Blastopirellula sp.]
MTDKSMNQKAIEQLIIGHFDGSLSEEQEKELAEAMGTSTASKQLFLSYMRMEGRLHSLGRDGFLREPAAEPQEIVQQPTDIWPVVPSVKQRSLSMRSRFWAASMSLTLCAAVVLMLTSGLWPSRVDASSVLQKAQQAAAEMLERTNRLILSYPDGEGGIETQEFTINIRSGGRFVIRPDDGSYVMGCDGTNCWATHTSGPVWVTSDFLSLAPELQRRIPNRGLLRLVSSPEELLLLDMPSLLSLIEREYQIELIDSADTTMHHVRATLQSGKRTNPQVVDFWANAETGVILRLELEWPSRRPSQLNSVDPPTSPDRWHYYFELIDSPTLSDNWYHYSEHAPNRQVKRVKAKKSE